MRLPLYFLFLKILSTVATNSWLCLLPYIYTQPSKQKRRFQETASCVPWCGSQRIFGNIFNQSINLQKSLRYSQVFQYDPMERPHNSYNDGLYENPETNMGECTILPQMIQRRLPPESCKNVKLLSSTRCIIHLWYWAARRQRSCYPPQKKKEKKMTLREHLWALVHLCGDIHGGDTINNHHILLSCDRTVTHIGGYQVGHQGGLWYELGSASVR